jgi:hypothetical protein
VHQDTQHQKPQALQTDGKSFWFPMQQHLLQQEIQRTGLSVQAASLSNSDMSKDATVVQQIITEPSEVVSENAKIMVTTKMVLNLMN